MGQGEGPFGDDPSRRQQHPGVRRRRSSTRCGQDRAKVWAKALVLEGAGGTRAALITIEVSNTYRDLTDRIRRQLAVKHQLPRQSVAICATHTHSGPVVGHRAYFLFDERHQRLKEEYDKTLEERVVAVVGRALDNLSPCDLSWSVSKANFAVNRRNNRAADVPELRAAGRLKGPVDHDVPVLFVENELDARATWIVAYANDGMGYIPSERVLSEGGYEGASAMIYYGQPSPWASGIEQRIVDEVHRQVKLVRVVSANDT